MEYRIKNLVNNEPKEWRGPKGTVWYIEVELEGHDKIVSIGKKEKDALKAGDTVYGDIVPTDYLSDKWKPSPPPEKQGTSQSFDDRGDAITASMVVKLAFQAFIQSEGMLPQEAAHWRQIDYMAELLKKSIDKVKGGVTETAKQVFKEPLPLPPEDLDET